jgi:hypothetical protein
MPFDSNVLLGIGGLITGVLGAIGAFIVSRKAARKDEVTLLREEIERLQKRVTTLTDNVDLWQKRYGSLFNYVLLLRNIMMSNNLQIPLMEQETNPPINKTNPNAPKPPIKMGGVIPPENMPKPSDDDGSYG